MENKKEILRFKRHSRIRMNLSGDSQRPRIIVHRSLMNIEAQVIDDLSNKTIFSMSTKDKALKGRFLGTGNIKAAQFLGEEFAKKAQEKGISAVVFDRAGYLYHGRVKAFAEALRKGGLVF